MVRSGTKHCPADSPIGDIAFLARADHRIPALAALTERPRSRSELCELTGVSSSTMRRTVDEFEDRLWIRKDDYQYVATRLGEAIASGMADLIDLVETERKLRHVWHWLPDEVSEFPLETWADLTVTVADPDVPYRPVNRFESLLADTTTVRFLRPEVALMEPCFDLLNRLLVDGVEVTVIDRPSCHDYFISTYPDRCSEMIQRDNFTVREAEDLPPYGTGLLDEQVVITSYEQDSGTVQAMVDTDNPSVREWATSLFDRHESTSRPLELQRDLSSTD